MDSTPAGICPGSCNVHWREATAAYWAAVAAYDPLDPAQSRPEPPSIKPVYGNPRWCARDASRVRTCLAELDELASQLGWHADGYPTALASETGRVSGTPETMSPSDAADELTDLMAILTEHETAFRETVLHIGAPPRRGYLASAASQCIWWLGARLDAVLASDVGEAFGLDILEWHRNWKRRAKAGQRKITKPLRCPTCRMLTLVWVEGDDTVQCHNPDNPDCRRVLSYTEYEALVEQRAGQPHRQETGHPDGTAA